MKFDTAYNHKERFCRLVDDCWSVAKSSGMHHDKLFAMLRERVYGDDAWKRCPEWVRCIVTTYDHAKLKEVQQHWLVWGVWHDGQFYSGWMNYPPEVQELIQVSPDGSPQTHYWVKPIYEGGRTVQIDGDVLTHRYKITQNSF